MLHQISWFTYAISIGALIAVYYLYVAVAFYRAEIKSAILKISGKQPAIAAANGDFHLPEAALMGKARPDEVEFLSQEELVFAPADNPDEVPDQEPEKTQALPGTNTRLISDFSEMVSEVKTLIRVISESNESKENFEMLFRLIVQKYSALAGTVYQQQVNDFLVSEGAPEFPFPLSTTELNNYWTI